MKRAIVTGATGFIGRVAVPALRARGFEVHLLSRNAIANSVDAFLHRVNLFADDGVAPLIKDIRATHLLHLAWCTEPPTYWVSPENLRWVQASLGLLAHFREAGGRRVVGVGTCAEYDWRYGYCIEGVTPTAPHSVYGVSKNCLRELQAAYCALSGISEAWGRVFHLYGPGEHPKRLVPTLVSGLLQGAPVPCSHGEQIRDYLHVTDAASALAALLDSDVKGPVNIGSGRPLAVRDLIRAFADEVDRHDLVRLGALPLGVDEPHMLVASAERLAKEVGWKPAFDLKRGVAETVEWWRSKESRQTGRNSTFPTDPGARQ